ncbi:branched-chain amino acid ABC transporter permease [Ktedonosporobacter rubrisoli]|uniref:Branched-chain amino acid ABC transporter permease n=1 Tax=Ktedonosporobacter rubrisoli TaxID=2509675 RepID=A0A4V0YZ09_KTERU|nr:branched-chain amino acid ABC transporter permease [Ktedonosporobacter rubrisoli]QBD78081.1 branched-chain amino acid ABC transporter permease [Ktedonosporobacter rubrisoli]
MSSSTLSSRLYPPGREAGALLVKWLVALLVPVVVFTLWSGEAIINNVLLGFFGESNQYDMATLVQAAIFMVAFYAAVIALAGYMTAADSGRRHPAELWVDVLVYTLVPLGLVIATNNLILGLALSLVIWVLYFFLRKKAFQLFHYTPSTVLENLEPLDSARQADLMRRAILGSFWFATIFAVISLVVDLIFFFMGSLPTILLIWVVARTIILPVAGYFLGKLGGIVALRRVISAKTNGNGESNGDGPQKVSRWQKLRVLSSSRASEEAKDIVPNDLPLRSSGAQRFYLILIGAFVLFYPVIDPFLFGFGTNGRLAGYGDAGFYIILALGLNIVVGFAGLLDLGYVAFFAIGSYVWGMFGSPQFQALTGIIVNPQVWPWFFWPMLLVAALIAALWGVILGAPTLRLRGDYLAIVTLGFGEIVPIVFLELDKYTNGTNGLVSVYSPKFPGVDWSNFTPAPYYYLIVALIVLCIFANIRLRDSRLGRAWIAIREDEIAAASSGINLARTKLFAFGAGAFFSGLAGMYHAAKLGTVTPDNFNSTDSIIYLAMVVIGGLGSIPGVIVGAIAVYAINLLILAQLDSLASDPGSFLHVIVQAIPGFTFGSIRNLIFGTILVIIMIYRPEGLIPSARRRRELHKVEEEPVEVGALDQPPGSAEFEAEVHVE